MLKKLYVGNLTAETSDLDITALFAAHGAVRRVRIVTNEETGARRGHAIVTMGSPEEAKAAIAALDGSPLGGQNLSVREARIRPRPAT